MPNSSGPDQQVHLSPYAADACSEYFVTNIPCQTFAKRCRSTSLWTSSDAAAQHFEPQMSPAAPGSGMICRDAVCSVNRPNNFVTDLTRTCKVESLSDHRA